METTPYSPDIFSCDFFLFLKCKMALNGIKFYTSWPHLVAPLLPFLSHAHNVCNLNRHTVKHTGCFFIIWYFQICITSLLVKATVQNFQSLHYTLVKFVTYTKTWSIWCPWRSETLCKRKDKTVQNLGYNLCRNCFSFTGWQFSVLEL